MVSCKPAKRKLEVGGCKQQVENVKMTKDLMCGEKGRNLNCDHVIETRGHHHHPLLGEIIWRSLILMIIVTGV